MTDDDPQLCTVCTARPPRPALVGSLVCDPCQTDMARMLEDLTRLLPVLRGLVEPGRSIGDGRGSGGAAPAPLRVDVLSLLNDTRHGPNVFLTRWGDPAQLRATLGARIERPDVVDLARDLRALHAAVIRVCGEPGPARVATCRRLIRGRECRGNIVATPGGDTARCERCGDDWPRSRWRLLGNIERTETAAELARTDHAEQVAG
jgi:hypothetical protein